MNPRVNWSNAKREIRNAVDELERQGMAQPPKRAVFYVLVGQAKTGVSANPWAKTKAQYDQMTRMIAQWRREGEADGLFPFGTFSDDAGASDIPMTDAQIVKVVSELYARPTPFVSPDGTLWAILVEHGALVPNLSKWMDGRVAVISSSGNIREESVYSMLYSVRALAEALGAKRVRVLALADYDKAGHEILWSHQKFMDRYFPNFEVRKYGVTITQVGDLGWDTTDDWQIDGFIATYGPERVRRELRQIVGLE